MALIPVERSPRGRGILNQRDPSVGFRWIDVFFSILFGLLLILLIFPPQETFTVEGIPVNVRLVILGLLIIMYIQKSIVKFDEYERGVVLRFGKFKEVGGPGWALVFPLVEKAAKVDLRLHVNTIDPQEAISRDKVRFLISAEVFMYVSNPKDAVLNVKDYVGTVTSYISSALIHTCGSYPSDYIVSHMNDLTQELEDAVHHISTQPGREWGVVVPKIRLTMLRFPDAVQDAMHQKVASEQLKLASHERAEAIKVEIDAIQEAGSKLTSPAITYMYLEALDRVSRGRATKIVLPLEVSKIAETMTKTVAGIRDIPSGIKEIPQINIPPELIEQYRDAVDGYEKRIKSIEGRLNIGAAGKKELVDKITDYEKEAKEPPDKKELGDKEENYKKRIKEIKERLGVED